MLDSAVLGRSGSKNTAYFALEGSREPELPQFGFQSTALVLVIANEEGMKGFMGDKVTLGGDLAVAVGPVGRQAGAATDADLQASIYSYSMGKGIFAGVSLEGAVIQPDESANELYWKSALRPDEILGRKTTDPRVQPLIKEINHILLKLSGGTDLKL